MTIVTYISPTAPSFTMNISVGGKKQNIKFTNKELHLDTEKDGDLISAMDKLIETTPNVSQLMQKVDPAVALKLAFAHKEQMAKMRGTLTGPVTSSDTAQQVRARMAERDSALAREGANLEDLEKMHQEIDKDLELTEDSTGKVAPDTRDGFVENQQPSSPVKPVEPVSAEATDQVVDPKAVFANLLGSKR